jgi:hypothetical protein
MPASSQATGEKTNDKRTKSTSNIKSNEEEKKTSPVIPRATSSPIEDKTTTVAKPKLNTTAESNNRDIRQDNGRYLSFAKTGTTSPTEGTTSPEGQGFEVIDPHEEINEVLESRVVLSTTDSREDLAIPAVNDAQGVSREFTVSAGSRYVVPVMVATPGATLCWSFRTVYKVHTYNDVLTT